MRRSCRVLSHNRIPTPFERRTTTIRISLNVMKLGTSSWSASSKAFVVGVPFTSTTVASSTFNLTLLPSNSKVPRRRGAREGSLISLFGSEPMILVPFRSQNKPASASQPFSRRRFVSISCRHLLMLCSYCSSTMLMIIPEPNSRPFTVLLYLYQVSLDRSHLLPRGRGAGSVEGQRGR